MNHTGFFIDFIGSECAWFVWVFTKKDIFFHQNENL